MDLRSRFNKACQEHRKTSGGRLTEADARQIAEDLGIPANRVPKVWDEEYSGPIGGSSPRSDSWVDAPRRYRD